MASIIKLTDKHRTKPWRAKVKDKISYWPTQALAKEWARNYEYELNRTGLPPSYEMAKKYPLLKLVDTYLETVTPTKGCAVSEKAVLTNFRKTDLCKNHSMGSLQQKDAYAYVQQRLKDTWVPGYRTREGGRQIKPSTVRREANTLHHVFEYGKKIYGLRNLENPFVDLDIKVGAGRERLLQKGELEALINSCIDCRGLNGAYIPLAIYLAIETGMRLQEIFNLTWQDVDIANRRIRITKSKTDYKSKYKGRTIVMSINAQAYLYYLGLTLAKGMRFGTIVKSLSAIKKEDRIFPMPKEAFKQSWADVVKRAKITDLHFHDLRHEAGSKFDKAGLTHAEHGLMMGHGVRTMRDLYSHATLQSIQEKLDKHLLNGKTWAEFFRETEQEPMAKEKKAAWIRMHELWADNKSTSLREAYYQAAVDYNVVPWIKNAQLL